MLFGICPLRTIATTVAVATCLVAHGQPLAVSGDADPLVRGWWNTARRIARGAGDDEAERLATIDRWEEEAAGAAAGRHGWLRDSRGWEQRWTRPVRGDDPPGRPPQPVCAGSVVAWEAGGAVHALLATTGLAAWRGDQAPDTAFFFPDTAPRRAAARPGWLAGRGHLLFAALGADEGAAMLACFDCSATAEGRLAWFTTMPAGLAACDGPPAVDAELCAVVCRAADERSPLMLVVCDARDGRLLWQRPCGATLANDGIDHGHGGRVPLLHEGLVIVADHAGSVTAFTREGLAAWAYRYDAAGRGPAGAYDTTAVPSLATGRDTLIVAPRDHAGLIALEHAGGTVSPPLVRWKTTTAARIVGTSPTRLVLETLPDRSLQTISIAAGEILARAAAMPGGGAILAGDVVIRPVASADGRAIVPLAVATLEPTGPPFPVGRADETAVAIAVGPAALAVATPGMLSFIAPRPAAPQPTP